MKRFALLGLVLVASAAMAQVNVNGYYRADGTYVAPYTRTAPNNSRMDNYSTRGNVNPYTGRAGTENPYPTYTPAPMPTYQTPHHRQRIKPPSLFRNRKHHLMPPVAAAEPVATARPITEHAAAFTALPWRS